MHTQREALCEVKRKLEFVTKKKEKEKEDYHFVSISHFVSLKTEESTKKGHEKRQESKVFFFGGFFCSLPLSRNLSLFAPKTTLVE